MTAILSAPADLHREFRGHLTGRVEQVGFFLPTTTPAGARSCSGRGGRFPPKGSRSKANTT
jgi:hypothetical protein